MEADVYKRLSGFYKHSQEELREFLNVRRKRAVITLYNNAYPVHIKPYIPNVKNKPVDRISKDPEQPAKTGRNDDKKDQNSSAGYSHKTAIDNANKINIAQVLSDFKGTLKAIGAPEDIENEVHGYLNLVELQAKKPSPSPVIIKSNLKASAEILDNYITETLNRKSNVVANWVDAILLQKIDYKYPNTEIKKPEIEKLSQSEEKKLSPKQVQPGQLTETKEVKRQNQVQSVSSNKHNKKNVRNLEDFKLKTLYDKFEKQFVSGDITNTLSIGEKTLKVAKKLNDKSIQSKVFLNIAQIHDENNDLPKALENYNNAAKTAKEIDNKPIQAKAHYNMASIYDDLGKTKLALDHYYTSLSLDGETENIKDQAMTLNNIGNILTAQKKYKSALDHYKLAYNFTKEQNDKSGQAFILSNVANIFKELGEDQKALELYKKSIKLDTEVKNPQGCAKSYEQAGDIMLKNGQLDKAKNLYKKSMILAQQIGDKSWFSRISKKVDKMAA